MPVAILMPALSPTMTEGNVAKWLKKIGENVKSGDIIAEVETDKATMEVEAIDEGVLAKIIHNDGSENIPVNSLIGVISTDGETEKDIENVYVQLFSYNYINCTNDRKICPICGGSSVMIIENEVSKVYKTCPFSDNKGFLTCDEYNLFLRGELKPKSN